MPQAKHVAESNRWHRRGSARQQWSAERVCQWSGSEGARGAWPWLAWPAILKLIRLKKPASGDEFGGAAPIRVGLWGARDRGL